MRRFEVAILGAGPAGLAAAERHRGAVIIDDNPAPGGQIWRGASQLPIPQGVTFLPQTRVFDVQGRFHLHTTQGLIEAGKLILATGARELFLPFPGWTEPGVFGAGGLQALVKGGLPIAGKRVVVAGTGPLLLAVAATLRQKGAHIVAIVEQAPWHKLAAFALKNPGKLGQAIALQARLLGVPYKTGVWPVAYNAGQLTLSDGETHGVDYVACGFGLVPNTEVAQLLGCRLRNSFVEVDANQQTSVEGVYCIGEPTGIGGLDKALAEGRGQQRDHSQFVKALAETFAINAALTKLAQPDTVLCRCEDVPLQALQGHTNWREAKLQTRCGMGPCQGRICGPIVQHLFGWQPESVRPPLYPVPASLLAEPPES